MRHLVRIDVNGPAIGRVSIDRDVGCVMSGGQQSDHPEGNFIQPAKDDGADFCGDALLPKVLLRRFDAQDAAGAAPMTAQDVI